LMTIPVPSNTPEPILTGEVTYCDSQTRTINLRFVDGFVTQDFQHQVTINGEVVNCKINESNSTLLTCSYPASIAFPANIQIETGGITVNDFDFNGAACQTTQKPDDNPDTCIPLPGKVCP